MPPRRFNGPQLMRARRAVDVSRRELAAAVGAKSQAIVGDWEAERTFPAGEKLPAIARGVRADIDVLFPREGACDLADLRCDAGYAQFAAAEALQISKYSLSRAERGARRLNEEWIAPSRRCTEWMRTSCLRPSAGPSARRCQPPRRQRCRRSPRHCAPWSATASRTVHRRPRRSRPESTAKLAPKSFEGTRSKPCSAAYPPSASSGGSGSPSRSYHRHGRLLRRVRAPSR